MTSSRPPSSNASLPASRSRCGRVARAAAAAAALGLAAITTSEPARATGDADLTASMQCERAAEPGRVRCTVEAHLAGGRALVWSDVEIVTVPDFAAALKGRIGPPEAFARDATSTRWALGLVAKRRGQGEVKARVRVVACDPAAAGTPATEPRSRCAPIVVEVRAAVTVG